MKSFDEWNAYCSSRSEEQAEEIIAQWVAAEYLDRLLELRESGVDLTTEVLRDTRRDCLRRADRIRTNILAEWAIARASERA